MNNHSFHNNVPNDYNLNNSGRFSLMQGYLDFPGLIANAVLIIRRMDFPLNIEYQE